VAIVLSLLILMPLAESETWLTQLTVHQHALRMLVALYDEEGDWQSYRTSLQVYIEETNFYNTNEPVILLIVPDPNGVPFNTDRMMLRPNEGHLDTDITAYREEEIVKVLLHSRRNNFHFKFYISTRRSL
jgi:hypothetical protein